MPVLGTYLLISFAHEETVVGRVLSLRPLVALGLISYSAYLWHQPLFAFLRIRSTAEPADWHYLVLTALSLLAAYLTWRYVEKPFRNRTWLSRSQVFALSVATSLLFVLASVWILLQQGALSRFSEDQQSLLVKLEKSNYQTKGFNAVAGKSLQSSRGLLIVGDSFAQDFFNMAAENGYLKNRDVSAYYIPNACGVVASRKVDLNDYVSESKRARCTKHPRFEAVQFMANLKKAETVFVVSNWLGWQIEFVPETLEYLSSKTNATIVIVGGKRFETPRHWSYLGLSALERAQRTVVIPTPLVMTNNQLGELLPPTSFIDGYAAFCDKGQRCRVFTPAGDPISNDGSHLTREGARFYGRILIRNTRLKDLLEPN